jgi:hypothetical protein
MRDGSGQVKLVAQRDAMGSSTTLLQTGKLIAWLTAAISAPQS